jgi:hypothetical protein
MGDAGGWPCSHWQDSRGNAPLPQKNDFAIHDFAKPAQNCFFKIYHCNATMHLEVCVALI